MAAEAPTQPRSEEALAAFALALAALSAGDLGALGPLASPELELVNDGGGRVHAARVRIHGLERVARVSERLQRRRLGQWEMDLGWLGDCPALRYRVRGGRRGEPDAGVIIGHMSGGQLLALWTVLNPEKLGRAELPALP
jgi:RNA polymerase sigma-70 factor (ECF subfamily)